MIRPDDSILTPPQLATVRRHADRLLREASALDRFPTPIDDIMAAAKLTVVDDEVLNETVLSQFLSRARAGLATIRSALSKVLGLFESNDRLVVIDRAAPKPRVPFINEGAVFIPTIDRLHSFISRSAGKRLTYRRLIA